MRAKRSVHRRRRWFSSHLSTFQHSLEGLQYCSQGGSPFILYARVSNDKTRALAAQTLPRSLVALNTFPLKAAGESFPLSAHHSANQRGRRRLHSASLYSPSTALMDMTSACLPCTHTRADHFHPLCPNKNCLFKSAQILIRGRKKKKKKKREKPFIQRWSAFHLPPHLLHNPPPLPPAPLPLALSHLSTRARLCAKQILNARRSAHVNTRARRPLIPRGRPSGGCLMQWPFVVETIFMSETQNGFINSIRG